MITNEMKANIFYMYPFAKIMYADTLYRLKSIDVDWDKMEIAAVGSGVVDTVRISGSAQLIITPLSEITDEDAIEVASVYHPEITWRFANRSRTFIELDGHDGQEFTLFYSLSVMSEDSSFDSILPGGDMKAHSKSIDFLRSKSYALPYMGIDLFESGIAIPNNKNQ